MKKSRQQVARERFKEQHFKNYKSPKSPSKNGLSPNPEVSKQDFERQVYTAAAALAASTPLNGSKPTSRPNSRPSNSRPVTPAKTGIDEQFRSSLAGALSKEKEKAEKAEKLENNKAEQASALSAALAAIPQAQKRVEQIPDFSKPVKREKRYRPLAHWSSTPRVAKLVPPPPTPAQAVKTPPILALHISTSSSQTKLSPHTPPTIEVSTPPKVRHYTVAHSDVVYSPSDIKLTRPVSRQHLKASPQSSVASPRTSFDVQSARNSPRSSMDTNRSLRSLRPDARPILGRNYNDFSTNSSINDSRSTVGGSRSSELSIPSVATSQESSISSSKSSEKSAKKSSKKFGWGKLASLFGSDPKRAVFALDPDLEEPKPEPPKIVEERAPMLHTLRKENKKKAFNVEKPWKGHKQVFYLNEKERKMYESVWAANKGTHLPYLYVSPEIEHEWNKLVNSSSNNSSGDLRPTSSENSINTIPTISTSASTSTTDVSINSDENSLLSFDNLDLRQQLKIRRDDIHGYAVARIWRRARLSEDTLAEIWDLVDLNKDGTLDRTGFVVGMWLCDQCLYGRKLPQKVPEEVWNSVDKLHLKVRVQKEKKRHLLVKKLPSALNHTVQGGRHVVKKAVQTATK